MKSTLKQIRDRLLKRKSFWIGLLLFLTCLFVYLANQTTISSSDNVSNSLLALNWLDQHSLNFDAFRGGYHYRSDDIYGADGIPHYFVEAPNGHLSSTYPIGAAIITFPIYCIIFIFIKLSELFQSAISGVPVDLLDLTDLSARASIRNYQKLAAATVASLSALIFYLTIRLKFNTAVALISTFIFAFATTTWVISSQGLWQHGSANLVVITILFCLLKANRATGQNRRVFLVLAGFFCGLLPGIRPTSLIYTLAAIAYALFAYRQEAIFLILGLPSALLSASWNFYYFGINAKNLIVAGYSRMSGQGQSFTQSYYALTLQQFIQGFKGLLFSPSRGLWIYTPVTLFAFPGLYSLVKRWRGKDEQLLLLFSGAALILFLQYCVFTVWSGGSGYGPRYLTDIIPILCVLIAYFVAELTNSRDRLPRKGAVIRIVISTLFAVSICFSTFTQVVGAFGSTDWDSIPYAAQERLWNWRDTQIARHTNRLFNRLNPPIVKPRRYLNQLQGEIVQITMKDQQAIATPWQLTPFQSVILEAQIKNTGGASWYGYETGLTKGLTVIRVRFFNTNQQEVKTEGHNLLYTSGNLAPGELGKAIGSILAPSTPGDYTAVFNLLLWRVGDFKDGPQNIYEVPIVVSSP